MANDKNEKSTWLVGGLAPILTLVMRSSVGRLLTNPTTQTV